MGKINTALAKDMLQAVNVSLQEQIEPLGDKFFEKHGKTWFISEKDRVYTVRSLSGPVATFSIEELDGCCGVAVSFHSEVSYDLRNAGLGRALLLTRMSACRRMGYGLVQATVLENNKIEQSLLLANGWIRTGEFRNPKTNNVVLTFQANL